MNFLIKSTIFFDFPVFKGTLCVRAFNINEATKVAAFNTIASLFPKDELKANHITPDALDTRVCLALTKAVKGAAIKDGIIQI